MKVLILGATSPIAVATARALTAEGASAFVLAGRSPDKLKRVADDLAARFDVEVDTSHYDAVDWQTHASWVAGLPWVPDAVVVATGLLGEQDQAQTDAEHAQAILTCNFNGVVTTLEPLAQAMQARGSGVIGVMGSVAGLRGRQSNYVYGSAKAGLHAYLSGLRNRLFSDGVHVTTALIGWVRTPMTAEFDLPAALVSEPAKVGQGLAKAMVRGKSVVYLPGYWRLIMWVIRSIPEALFKRLKL